MSKDLSSSPSLKDSRMMVDIDEKFAREYPKQARELQIYRANMMRILDKVNQLVEATEEEIEPLSLWFPEATGKSMQPPAWKDFVREVSQKE